MISAIVAVDNNWGIGFNGDLLEHIPEDLKYFKELTSGGVVIMGRKTWDSLPKKPLPNRVNIVITSNPKEDEENIKYMTLEEAKAYAIVYRPQKIFIIGGESIYKEFLPLCKKLYITKIYKTHESVDSYFPNIDKMNNEWAPDCQSALLTYKDFYYQFWQYDRF